MGSFEYSSGLTDRILTIKGVKKYFGSSPLVYAGEDADGYPNYQTIPGLGVNIKTNRTTKKCSAEIKQIQTLDHIVSSDKIHSKLERRLGAENYWPHSIVMGIGCGIINPLLGVGAFASAKTIGAGVNQFYKVPHTVLANGAVKYEIKAPTQCGRAWTWCRNRGRGFKRRMGYTAPNIKPEKYHRTFIVAPLDTENYIIKYEAHDVPRRVIVRDMDKFRRSFVAAQRTKRWRNKLSDLAEKIRYA
jgi:hypothetical protein